MELPTPWHPVLYGLITVVLFKAYQSGRYPPRSVFYGYFMFAIATLMITAVLSIWSSPLHWWIRSPLLTAPLAVAILLYAALDLSRKRRDKTDTTFGQWCQTTAHSYKFLLFFVPLLLAVYVFFYNARGIHVDMIFLDLNITAKYAMIGIFLLAVIFMTAKKQDPEAQGFSKWLYITLRHYNVLLMFIPLFFAVALFSNEQAKLIQHEYGHFIGTVLWTVEGLLVVFLGYILHRKWLIWTALFGLGYCVWRVFTVDLPILKMFKVGREDQLPLAVILLLVGLGLIVSQEIYKSHVRRIKK